MAHAVEGVGYRIEHSCTHRELARAGSWKNFGQTGAYTKTKLQPITSAPRHRLFASPCSTSVPGTPQSERKRNRFSTPFPILWSKEHLRELSFECDCQAYNYYYLFFSLPVSPPQRALLTFIRCSRGKKIFL
ncbi:hypothetical protein TNCV_492131 [Trichonephila clavipes]|nr:hypothetical protein TNCV_492131 [Trichonephila clavipes]